MFTIGGFIVVYFIDKIIFKPKSEVCPCCSKGIMLIKRYITVKRLIQPCNHCGYDFEGVE